MTRYRWHLISAFSASLLVTTAAASASASIKDGIRQHRPPYFGLVFTQHSPGPGSGAQGWLTVQDTAAGGPAERAGLKPGDLIIEIEGRPLQFRSGLDVLLRLAQFKPGETVKLTILRNRTRKPVELIGVPMSDRQYEEWKAHFEFARKRLGPGKPRP